MPRKGSSLTKEEIWSLLCSITDELATVSATVIDLKTQICGYQKSIEEHGRWAKDNTSVLSVRLPNDVVSMVDERIEETGAENRNTYLKILISNDLTKPIEKGTAKRP